MFPIARMFITKPNIGLFICGEFEMAPASDHFFDIKKNEDAYPWLHVPSEVSILANVKTFIVRQEQNKKLTRVQSWQQLAQRIWSEKDLLSGVVVVQSTAQLSFLSAALDVLFPKLHLPIVVTGASIKSSAQQAGKVSAYEDLSLKANLINAIHTSTLDVVGATMLYDTAVYRADDVTREGVNGNEVFQSFSGNPFGEVRLGVTLNEDRLRRADVQETVFEPQMSENVAVVYWTPTFEDSQLFAYGKKDLAGVIVRGEPDEMRETGFQRFVKKFSSLPIYFYHPQKECDCSDNVVSISGISFESAFTRVLASLARGVQFSAV